MLTAVLPGLRHLRTPLVAGSLWFLVGWLWFGPGYLLPSAVAGEGANRLQRAVELVGPSVTLAAVSLTAVLVGGLIPAPSKATAIWLLGKISKFTLRRVPKFSSNEDFFPLSGDVTTQSVVRRIAGDAAEDVFGGVTWTDIVSPEKGAPRAVREGASYDVDHARVMTEDLQEEMAHLSSLNGGSDDLSDDPVPLRLLIGYVAVGLGGEVRDLERQLQVERETLWNDVDRLNGEADLRLALVVPLVALAGVLTYWYNATWLLLVLLAGALFAQAAQSANQSRLLVFEALEGGHVQSRMLQFLAQFDGAAAKWRDDRWQESVAAREVET